MSTTGDLEISLKDNHIVVKVDGAARAIDVWPPDNEYVTFQWLAKYFYKNGLKANTLKQRAKRKGHMLEDNPKDGHLPTIQFSDGKMLTNP